MSSMTFGPPVVLDGPLPVAPRRSLITVPGVLQDPGDERWMNGVSLWGYPDATPETWDPCSVGSFGGVKSDVSNIPTPDFAAFAAYIPVTCSAISIASDPAGFAAKAERALDARISFPIEAALAGGVPMVLNPYLGDANATILAGGAAVNAATGFAYLEEAIGGTAQGGMIHVTPGAASAYFGDDRWGGDGSLATGLGTPVAVGGGYAGVTPSGEAAASAGQSWAFATGPVQVWVSPETTLTIDDVLDRSINDVTFRAERYVLALWDTSLQAAVLIDWST